MSGRGLTFRPLTAARWGDLEALFGERGACGGCWCQWWKRPRAEFLRNKGEGNRRALRRQAGSGRAPGVLAYAGREPVGWCALEPREAYPVLARSRVLKPIDERPVWSVTCLFVRRDFRGRGVSVRLLGAAAAHARRGGARLRRELR